MSLFSIAESGIHRRAWQLWAETVQPSEQQPVFLSVHAKSLNDFKKGRANNSDIIQMGIDCPTRYCWFSFDYAFLSFLIQCTKQNGFKQFIFNLLDYF